MRPPDVNVWLAAAWARHSHHRRAKAWRDQGQAWDLADRLLADPRVGFLAEPDTLVPLWMAFSNRDDRQVRADPSRRN